MRRLFRGISALAVLGMVVFHDPANVMAAVIEKGYSIVSCYSNCGQYMGGACLDCDFEYADGSYVAVDCVSTCFFPNLDYNYVGYFHGIDHSSGVSTSEVSAWCDYIATDGTCDEYGRLDVSCDIYGQISDNGYCKYRKCDH